MPGRNTSGPCFGGTGSNTGTPAVREYRTPCASGVEGAVLTVSGIFGIVRLWSLHRSLWLPDLLMGLIPPSFSLVVFARVRNMRLVNPWILLSAALAVLTGCATADSPVPAAMDRPAPPSRAAASGELSQEVLYDILVGELAHQEGDLTLAVRHYLHAARKSRDPEVAERAARLVLQARDHPDALEAARLWLALDPDNLEAHQAVAMLYLQEGNAPQAILHLQYLLDGVEQRRKGAGYLLVTNLLQRGQDKALALKVIERLVSARMEEPDALFAYAVLALNAKRNDLALEQAARAIALRPDWPGAWALYVQGMAAQEKFDLALAELQQAVERHNDNPRLRVVLARALVENKRYEAANTQFELLLELSPDDVEVIYPLALLALNMRHEATAERYLKRLVELNHRADEAHFYLGQLAESAKRYPQARDWYQKVGGDQHGVEARIRSAVVTAKEGDVEAARTLLQSLRSENRDLAVRLYLAEGEVLREAGRVEAQIEVLTAALTEYPGNEDLLYARALTAEKLNRIDWLERDLREILAADADNAAALNALGYTLTDRTDRHTEALGYIQRALELEPDDPAILDSMGWVLYRLGRNVESIEHLRKALALGHDAEIAAHLGEVLWVSGEQSEARMIWNKALENAPDAVAIYETMKRLLR